MQFVLSMSRGCDFEESTMLRSDLDAQVIIGVSDYEAMQWSDNIYLCIVRQGFMGQCRDILRQLNCELDALIDDGKSCIHFCIIG